MVLDLFSSLVSTPNSKRKGKWTNVRYNGLYTATYAGSICSIDTNIYIFGGYDGNGDTQSLYILDTEKMEWKKPLIYGTLPSARSYHTLSVIGTKLYLFGGYSKATSEALNDLYVLDTISSKLEWKSITWEGISPVERYEHTTNVIGSKLVVFGGGNSRGWLNDVVIFDTITCKWKLTSPIGKKPQKRLAHASSSIGDNIYIFGGYNAKRTRLNDICILNTNINKKEPVVTWIDASINGYIPQGRAGHCIHTIDNDIILFGGYNNDKERLADLYCFNPSKLSFNIIQTTKNIPPGRSYHYGVVVGRRLYIIGGYNGKEVLSDIWYLDIDYVAQPDELTLPKSTLSSSYKQLVNSKEYSDVIFKLDNGNIIYGHRLILTCRNDHFRAMLSGGMKESNEKEITINDVDSSLFLSLLEHIYSDNTELTEDNVVDLYKISHRFGERLLQLKCEKYIEYHLDLSNVCDCYYLSNHYYAEHLNKVCLNYIVINYKFISKQQSFKLLPNELKDKIHNIIKHNTSLLK